MKSLRALCYLGVGLLLGANVVLAYAAEQPAVFDWLGWSSTENYFSGTKSFTEATVANCDAVAAAVNGTNIGFGTPVPVEPDYTSTSYNIYVKCNYRYPPTAQYPSGQASSAVTHVKNSKAYKCPDSTWTLSGLICTKIDACPPSQILPEGATECICDPSNLDKFPTLFAGDMHGFGESPDAACVGGCMRKTGSMCIGGGGEWWCDGGAWTSQKCTEETDSTPKPPTEKPPCDASEGVLTSSSGHVLCVPEGTPTARKPEVKKTDKTTKTGEPPTITNETKTVTKDPATGATDTHVSTTTTNPDGTSTTKETSSGGSNGDESGEEPGECAKEPDSPLCKKGEVGEAGEFTDRNPKIAEAKNELISYFNQVRGEISSMFSALGGGGGSLPCPPSVSVLGATIKVCASDYANQLSKIGAIVIAMATLVAAFIIFKG